MSSVLKSEPWQEIDTCPICRSKKIGMLYTGDRYDMNISTSVCNDCFFVFTNPYPSDSLILSFYQKEYWDLYFKNAPNLNKNLLDARRSRCKGYLDLINREVQLNFPLDTKCHLIDFGGGEGIFTEYVKKESKYRTYLFEPSESERESAIVNNRADLITFDENALTINLNNNRQPSDLTIASCIHVLEHLTDFPKFFQFLDNVLRYDDLVYIDVPNLLAYRHIKEIHIAHKSHFSQNTLVQLFCKYGYECKFIEAYEPSFHPASIRAIFKKVNGKVQIKYNEDLDLDIIQRIFSCIAETERTWNSPISKAKRRLKKFFRFLA